MGEPARSVLAAATGGMPLTSPRMVVDRLPERIDILPGEVDLVLMHLGSRLANLWSVAPTADTQVR